MGGGGGRPKVIADIDALINKAKKELQKETEQRRHNVFISFAYEDIDTVNLLRGQAKNENTPIDFNDWSISEPIDSSRAVYIKEKISERIERTSVTVVFLSNNSAHSRWVQWEIEESIRQGKRVIGVHPNNDPPTNLPEAFKKQNLKYVPWSNLASELNQ